MKRQTHSLNPFIDQHQDLRLAVCDQLHSLTSLLCMVLSLY